MATVATQLNSGSGFSSGEIVTAVKLNNLINTATVTGIVNADVDSAAAIAGTKISPNFGSQNISTTGTLASGNTTISGTLAAGTTTITGTLTASGDITAFSDARLKDNVETIVDALQKVTALRGVAYIKDGKASIGVIAQEVQTVVPEVVSDNGEYLSVAYGNIVALLIEAVKELSAKVEALQK